MKIKLSIEEPCEENWNKMKEGIEARYCDKCEKNVKDFTGMGQDEIFRFLKDSEQDKTGNICGRIYKTQLGIIEYNENITSGNTSVKNNPGFSPAVALTIAALTLASCNDNVQVPEEKAITHEQKSINSELENPNKELLERADSLYRAREKEKGENIIEKNDSENIHYVGRISIKHIDEEKPYIDRGIMGMR